MLLRRLLWVIALCAATAAGLVAWQRRAGASPEPIAAPSWPPLDPPGDRPIDAPFDAPLDAPAATTWAEPVGGACPDGYPIKAKRSSGIYHVPGGRSYDRTVPDRCYADPAAAEADGYRAAKS